MNLIGPRLSALWVVPHAELSVRLEDELSGQVGPTIRNWFRDGPVTAWKLASWRLIRSWPEYHGTTHQEMGDRSDCHRSQFVRIESESTLSEGLFGFLQSAANRYVPSFASVPLAEQRRQAWIWALAYTRAWLERRTSETENARNGPPGPSRRAIHPIWFLTVPQFALLETLLRSRTLRFILNLDPQAVRAAEDRWRRLALYAIPFQHP